MTEISAEWEEYFRSKGVAEIRWQEANQKLRGQMAVAARAWIEGQEKAAEAAKDSLAREAATTSMNEAKKAHSLSRFAVIIAFFALLVQAAQYFWPQVAAPPQNNYSTPPVVSNPASTSSAAPTAPN
jgi:hypothetical protein